MRFLYIFFFCVFIGSCLLAYSLFYEPYTLEVIRYKLPNPQLRGMKLVFASDFHIARHYFEKKLFLICFTIQIWYY